MVHNTLKLNAHSKSILEEVPHKKKIVSHCVVRYEMGVTYVSYYTKKNGEKIESALDHIYTNDTKTFNNEYKLLNNGMSDHCPILCDMKLKKDKAQEKKRHLHIKTQLEDFQQ